MATHHGQLKAMYGILHLAAKIIDLVDVKETLFVDVVGHTPRPELEPRRWRSAVQTDSFFDARHFGFHYKVRFQFILLCDWGRILYVISYLSCGRVSYSRFAGHVSDM
jgi:hypothetical protein